MARGGGIGRLLKQLAVEDWVSRAIDEHFVAREPERWVTPGYIIHPHAAGSHCERDLELWLLGHRAAVKERNRRRMDNGTDGHTRWQRYFADMGILVAKEWPLNVVEPTANGRMDLVLQNPLTGGLAVGEIKTTNSRKFAALPPVSADRAANARAMYNWHREWFLQFVWYSVFGDYNGRRFDEKFFLIENTDNQDYKVILVEPTADHIEEARRRPREAQSAVLAGRILERPYERGSPVCARCERAAVCDMVEDGEEGAWETLRAQFKKLKVELKSSRSGPGAMQ